MADTRARDEASRGEGDALTNLWNLHAEGIKPTVLARCHGLAQEATRLIGQLPGESSSKVLDALLRRIIADELTSATPNRYLRAAGEFIGIRDEKMADPTPKPYEVRGGRRASPFKMSIYRGGHHLGIGSYNNARHHVGDALEELLTAIRRFVTASDKVDKFVNDFKHSVTEFGATEPGSTSEDQHPADGRQHEVLYDYIPRPILEAQFKTLEKSGAKLIALVGLPGMGKSSLARALTPDAPFIEFHDGKPLLTHLIPALKDYGLDFHDLTEANAGMKLVELLIAEPGPKFVVLDNLQSTSELRHLVPHTTAAIVVATCRESGDRAPAHCTEVVIGAMRPNEALSLVKTRLSLNDEDARSSAAALGYYPLVICIACGHVRTAEISMRALCSSLQVAPGDIKSEGGEKLRKILERTVMLLRERNPIAVELLAFTVSAKRPIAPRSKGLLALTCELYGFDVGPHKYADATLELTRSFLVELGHLLTEEQLRQLYGVNPGDDVIALGGPSRVKVHPLLRSVLSSLLEDDISRIDAMAYQCWERLIDISQRMLEKLEPYDGTLEARIQDIDDLLNIFHQRDLYLETGGSGGQCIPPG